MMAMMSIMEQSQPPSLESFVNNNNNGGYVAANGDPLPPPSMTN